MKLLQPFANGNSATINAYPALTPVNSGEWKGAHDRTIRQEAQLDEETSNSENKTTFCGEM